MKIDPIIIEIAAKAHAAALATASPYGCMEAALSAAAPLLVAAEREAVTGGTTARMRRNIRRNKQANWKLHRQNESMREVIGRAVAFIEDEFGFEFDGAKPGSMADEMHKLSDDLAAAIRARANPLTTETS